MGTLSKAQLDAIRKRADAATDGPWEWHSGNLITLDDAAARSSFTMGRCVLATFAIARASVNDLVEWGYIREVDDAAFIAHARVDVPALLAHIDALEAALERLRGDEAKEDITVLRERAAAEGAE